MMIRSKARTTMKQYIKNKPVKRGFKIWAYCDSSRGYVGNLDFYGGADDELPSKVKINPGPKKQ